MAIFRAGALVSQISGSVAGTTFTRTGVIKSRQRPRAPRRPLNGISDAADLLQSSPPLWNLIPIVYKFWTRQQPSVWKAYAAAAENFTSPNALSQSQKWSGWNLFLSVQSWRLHLPIGLNRFLPGMDAIPGPVDLEITTSPPSIFNIVHGPPSTGSNQWYQIKMGRSHSTFPDRPQKYFAHIITVPLSYPSTTNIFSFISNRLGPLSTDEWVSLSIRYLQERRMPSAWTDFKVQF